MIDQYGDTHEFLLWAGIFLIVVGGLIGALGVFLITESYR